MFSTCDSVLNMGMIQIRNVPEPLHRKLKAKAAEEGLTLSDYLLRMAERDAARPTIAELSERLRARGTLRLPPGTVERALEEGRDAFA
jgi:hypothetical protein